MKAGINSLTAALVIGVAIGLALTPDGRAWLRHPTLLLGGQASASASPASRVATATPAPAAPAVTPLKDRFARGSFRIGVFGDSMGDGLWTGLYRDLQDQPGVTVTRFSEVSTGLSRYDYVDVQAKTEDQIADTPIDVAVILFGTNDAQAISLDGRVEPFGSEGWKAAYARRIDDLVALLRSRNIAVYWVGMPRMKGAVFDRKMAVINAVASARTAALGVPFIDTVALTSDAEGRYQAYFSNPGGRPVLMRANDGIHMSTAGYQRIGDAVAARLRADAGLTGPSAAQPAGAAG